MNVLSYNDREGGSPLYSYHEWCSKAMESSAVQRCTVECNEVNSGLVECSGQACEGRYDSMEEQYE